MLAVLLTACGGGGDVFDVPFPEAQRPRVIGEPQAKNFWADPRAPEPERVTKVTLENPSDRRIRFRTSVSDAPLSVDPPSGELGPGGSVCLTILSHNACWALAAVTVHHDPADPTLGEPRGSTRVTFTNNTFAPKDVHGRLIEQLVPGTGPITYARVPCDVTFHSNVLSSRTPEPSTDIILGSPTPLDLQGDPVPDASRILHGIDGGTGVIQEGIVRTTQPSAPFVAGLHRTFFLGVDGDIPMADATSHFQYALVLDADGVAANNYVPPAAFPGDYFQGTDLWYEVNYSPAGGWTLDVTDARNNVFTPLVSGAVAVIVPRGVLFVIPASEIADPEPGYRLTAFRHEGDFGLNSPFVWSANTSPPMQESLRTWSQP